MFFKNLHQNFTLRRLRFIAFIPIFIPNSHIWHFVAQYVPLPDVMLFV